MKPYSLLQNHYLFLLFIVVLSGYLWIAYSISAPYYFHFTSTPTLTATTVSGYHQLLADAFWHHQLSLRVLPAPELLALSDPYDPNLNTPYRLLDASLYQGKYYLYFTPLIALLFELPFKALSGYYISESVLMVLFCFTGFVFSVYTLRRLFLFMRAVPSKPMQTVSALTLATATAVPLLLNNPIAHSLPSALAYAVLMMALFFLVSALNLKKRKTYLLAAGLCLGLCFMARPNQLVTCIALALSFLTLFYVLYRHPPKHIVMQGLILLGPLVVLGLMMAGYNFSRFHSLFEFGFSYQLRASILPPITASSLVDSVSVLFVYLFEPWAFNLNAPYFHLLNNPIALFGSAQNGFVVGVLMLPVYWLVIHPLFYLYAAKPSAPKLWVGLSLLGTGLLSLLTDALLTGAGIRYMVDFLPLMLLATLLLFFTLRTSSKREDVVSKVAFSSFFFYSTALLTNVLMIALVLNGYVYAFRGLPSTFVFE